MKVSEPSFDKYDTNPSDQCLPEIICIQVHLEFWFITIYLVLNMRMEVSLFNIHSKHIKPKNK